MARGCRELSRRGGGGETGLVVVALAVFLMQLSTVQGMMPSRKRKGEEVRRLLVCCKIVLQTTAHTTCVCVHRLVHGYTRHTCRGCSVACTCESKYTRTAVVWGVCARVLSRCLFILTPAVLIS